MSHHRLMLQACLLLLTGFVHTQDNPADLMDLSLEDLLEIDVSSASKTSMKADDAPGIVSVITREDIRNLGAETLEDVLNLIPGLTVGRSLQNGLHNTLYVRGAFSLFAETVLILHNGRRLNDPITGGAMSFSPDFPLSYVKQVEIIRGPGSALYGANAFVALINIITDETEREGFEGSFHGGSGEGNDVSVFYGKSFNDHVHFSLTANVHQYELEDIPVQSFTQFESLNPPPFDIGLAFNTEFEGLVTADQAEALKVGLALKTGDLEFRLDYEDFEASSNWGTGVRPELVDGVDFTEERFRHRGENDVLRLAANYSRDINDSLSVRAALTYNEFDHSSRYLWASLGHIQAVAGDGVTAGTLNPRKGNSQGIEATLEWRPLDGHLLVAGYSHIEDEVDETPGLENTGLVENGVVLSVTPFTANGDGIEQGDRTIDALYAQYTWEVNDKVAMTGGVRGDDYSDFGSTVNPRLAVVYKPADKLNVKALYGEAFRAPTFLETNNLIVGGVLPNKDLQPEEIQTVELQLNYRPMPTLRTALSVYSYEVDNVLRQVRTGNPNANFETQTQNSGMREGDGLEFEFRYQPGIYKMFFLNYSLVDSNEVIGDVETDVQAIPEQSINFGFSFDFSENWVAGLSGHYRGSWTSQTPIALPDIPIPGFGDVAVNFLDEAEFPSYTIINANVQWREILRGGDLLFEVENILDQEQVFGDQHSFTPGGVATSARVFKIGFHYKL